MTKKIFQKQLAFIKLYQEYNKDPERYVATWEFVGELHIPEFGRWGHMSYKCPARLSEIHKDNPNLLERKQIKGKSGSIYYGYRIKGTVNDLQESSLKEMYRALRSNRRVEVESLVRERLKTN